MGREDDIQKRHLRGILLIGCFFTMFVCIQFIYHLKNDNEKLRMHEVQIISSLQENGVSEQLIANVYIDPQITQQGENIAKKIGIIPIGNEKTKAEALEYIKTDGIVLGIGTIFFFALLFVEMNYFFVKQNKIFTEAASVIERFAKGDFSEHLPRNKEGAMYHFLSKADQLSLMLQSKGEVEKKEKLFLQDTISDISHQLKTPLAALHMYNEIIGEEPENIKIVKDFNHKSEEALVRMDILIQSLLKIAKLDAGSIFFEKDTFLVTDVVQKAVQDLCQRAQKEKKTLQLIGNEDDVIFCDIQWTVEAIGNLVKNALDYTKEGDCVIVNWKKTPVSMLVSVKDTGCGIEESEFISIFKKFYCSEKTNQKRGFGLGLPLAKTVVEGQGGTLAVNSILGKGSEFTCTFLTKP